MDQLQGVITQLGIDSTILFLFVLMFVFYMVFSSVYLKPYQRLIEERKKKTHGSKESAKEMLAIVDQKAALYSEKLKKVHDQVRTTMVSIQTEAKKEESKIIGDATIKAKEMVHSAVLKLEQSKAAVLKEIETEVPSISAAIAEKVLGRRV